MKRFKSIIVVCQEDSQPELAIEQAKILAKENDASIALVDVINSRESEMAGVISGITDRAAHDLTGRLFDYHKSRLAEYGRALRESGIETTQHVLWGVGFVEIIRAVLRNGHDLVIKAISPNQFRGQRILGSLDMHLMRKCPCPVWVLRDDLDQDHLRVLAAVDPDNSDADRDTVNRLIMDLSTSFCADETGELHVLHAWALDAERALLDGQPGQAPVAEIDAIKDGIRTLREQELNRLVSSHPAGDKCKHTHLLQGNAGDVVPEFVASRGIDLVVMGTVSRTDVPGMFMGDTAEMILNRVSCSILAVKPPNFRTPIELDATMTGSRAAMQTGTY